MSVSDRQKRHRRPNGQAAVRVHWKFDRSTIAAVQILAAADGVSPSRWADRVLQSEIERRDVSAP